MATQQKEGYIYFMKDGILHEQPLPAFGSLTLKCQNGKPQLIEYNETKKV